MNKKMLCLVTIFMLIAAGNSGFTLSECAAAGNETILNEPKHGGELVIGMVNFPAHLNPAIHSGNYTGMPGNQLFASPLRYDDKWNPRPYLAEKWEVSQDGLSVTLNLVKDAVFHDGKPVTSEDIAFSVMTVKNNHPFNTMFAPVEKVETPDPHTAVICLSRPHPAILLAMSSSLLPVLPKHIYGDGRDIRTHPANMAPIGSGPFKFVEFIPGQHILLERSDKFFIKDRPFLDKIRYKMFKIFDHLALAGGEVHIIPFYDNPFSTQLFENEKNLVSTTKGYEAIGPLYWFAFNIRKKPFDDIRVRQAIAYCIDRKFIAEKLFGKKITEATGPIVPDSPFYSADVKQYEVDVKKANDLLDQAGYHRDKTGKRFKAVMDFLPANPEMFITLMEYVRDDVMRKIGVDLVIRETEHFPQWAEIVSNGNFELTYDTVFNWGDPVIGVHRTYDCNNIRKGVIWSNTQGYCNPKVNELMEAAAQEMNFEKRKALYAEFQKIVVHDLPILFLTKVPYVTLHNKNLAGLNDSIWGLLSPLDQVYWKEKP
ncbi:ABC transporter substrate-binding protein [Desulfonema limicola]|nr:ABC transporter substrate-binding protein [Desulfonema limicola]